MGPQLSPRALQGAGRWRQHDAAAFNKALAKALEEHKKYWSQKAGKRHLNASEFLALGPTALASFAHEVPLAIEIVSDYLLAPLVRGECHPA